MAIFLLLLTIIALAIAIGRIFFALKKNNRSQAAKISLAMLSWLCIYFSMLLAVSLTSQDKILGLEKSKTLCGCYLDCNLSASIQEIKKVKEVGEEKNRRAAIGAYYIVSIKLSNSSGKDNLRLRAPEAVVLDSAGKIYPRDTEAEELLVGDGKNFNPLAQSVSRRSGNAMRLVFDLPDDIKSPHLLIDETYLPERLMELFLIGNENSLLHKKRYFQLEQPPRIIFQDGDTLSIKMLSHHSSSTDS